MTADLLDMGVAVFGSTPVDHAGTTQRGLSRRSRRENSDGVRKVTYVDPGGVEIAVGAGPGRLAKVGRGDPIGVPWRPLHQLDAVAVRVGEP
jgi:hypothetical protein